MACYGVNGLTGEHRQAIGELAHLEEIIFAFDSDSAGMDAAGKYAAIFREEYPGLKLTTLDLPCKDVNETLNPHCSPSSRKKVYINMIHFFIFRFVHYKFSKSIRF